VGVAIVLVPVLALLTTPLFIRAARSEPRFDLGGLMACGLFLRFLGSYYRFTHAADAGTYHDAGALLAQSFRRLQFGVDPSGPVPGTGAMKIITGVVEAFTNGNEYATFLVFTWFGFLGCYLFYRALVTALPDADHRRYAYLVFLWPTLIFWPSSIGKDCWMLLTLGLAALGAARVLVRRPGGYTLLLLGVVGGSMVRPHVSLLVLAGFGIALFVGRRHEPRPGTLSTAMLTKVLGLIVLIALGAWLVSRTQGLLSANDVNSSSIDAALSENAHRTGQGGSAFTPSDPKTPQGYAIAAGTILFRPFPMEAHGTDVIATSIEALFLAGLVGASWRRLASIPFRLRGQPYVALALAYTLMFFFAFGTISNFGILARQRSQLMPFFFVLLALGARSDRRSIAPRDPPLALPRR
jgi:hypothetical protein